MPDPRPLIWISIVDTAVRCSTKALLETRGYRCFAYSAVADLLDAYEIDVAVRPDCVIIDTHLIARPINSVLKHLAELETFLPVLLVLGQPISVTQIPGQRVETVVRPYEPDQFILAIQHVMTIPPSTIGQIRRP